MSKAFECFQTEYEDFRKHFGNYMEEGTVLPKDMGLHADIHMYANEISKVARAAVAGGLNVKQANFVQIAMESLEHILGESYKIYAPDSLFKDLEDLRVSNTTKPPEGLHPSNNLDFHLDLDM